MSEQKYGITVPEALLVPEQYLPSQLPRARRDSLVCGEKALMLAVLEDAIRCLDARTRAGARRAREAERWIRADDHDWPFSFLNVCAHLEIDMPRLRAALLARVAGRASGVAPNAYRLHLRLKPARPRLRLPAEPRAFDTDVLPKRAAQG
jgi:hypothetical protein